MKHLLLVVGTRPEAIKMAPLINLLKKRSDIKLTVCNSGQHSEMIDQVFELFEIKPDADLKIMGKTESLTDLYSLLLSKLSTLVAKIKPDMILVHGDTATAAASAMTAFFNQIECTHIEAGLRTGNMFNPWPEEFNRKLISMVTKHHFAPTAESRANLLREGVDPKTVKVTGNTVIDALLETKKMLNMNEDFKKAFYKNYPFVLDKNKEILLVTAHRRENLESGGINKICQALRTLISNNKDIQIVFSVHPNPKVQKVVNDGLASVERIHLVEPLDYKNFVFMMDSSHIVITDSGGIQEEAPSLGKPVLVTRGTTERPEAVMAGTARLVGTDPNQIVYWAEKLLNDVKFYYDTSQISNPYGDGKACARIVESLLDNKIISVEPEIESQTEQLNL